MNANILILTEDTGKQAQPTIQKLTKSAIQLIFPGLNTRRLIMTPLPERELAVKAVSANRWKTTKPMPEKIRLLGEIAARLMHENGFVVFHVDADTTWTQRASSDNRLKFETIIRNGVVAVLMGSAPHSRVKFVPLSHDLALQAVKRLFLMSPCYSVESWLYQATAKITELCRAAHSNAKHEEHIASWKKNGADLDEVMKPKDVALECIGDSYNEVLSNHFPAQEVRAIKKSWSAFVELLSECDELKKTLAD